MVGTPTPGKSRNQTFSTESRTVSTMSQTWRITKSKTNNIKIVFKDDNLKL